MGLLVLSIKAIPNHGVNLIELLWEFTSKDYFYPKKIQEKNINVLHTEMQGHYNTLNIEFF